MKTMIFAAAAAAIAFAGTAASAEPYDYGYGRHHGSYARHYWRDYCERVPFDPRCMRRYLPYHEAPAYGGGYPHPHHGGYGPR